ncbi:hypothetical protein IJV79_04465 [bacterium]|nr:hypothetical protein [bacterium]
MSQYKIGFWGYPDPQIVKSLEHKNAQWIDLDVDFNYPETNILPDAYCKIIKNIIDNAFHIKPDLIVGTIGKDKCDSGWFASCILKDLGFNVIQSKYETTQNPRPTPISTSDLSLRKKIELITAQIIKPIELPPLNQCNPTFGFWGVPPNDLTILELFPNTTHVFGWTRCVEANVPADVELEMDINKNIPTVFYSQAFCAKSQLAKYLAKKYDGLYIDIDDYATNSVKAKIEAFLKLR